MKAEYRIMKNRIMALLALQFFALNTNPVYAASIDNEVGQLREMVEAQQKVIDQLLTSQQQQQTAEFEELKQLLQSQAAVAQSKPNPVSVSDPASVSKSASTMA